MIVYETCGLYVVAQKTIEDKIAAIDAVIDALIASSLDMAAKDSIQEYSLNDGQTIIKTIYKGSVGIASAIRDFQRIRNVYVNQLNGGRMVRLVDSKAFQRRNYRNGR